MSDKSQVRTFFENPGVFDELSDQYDDDIDCYEELLTQAKRSLVTFEEYIEFHSICLEHGPTSYVQNQLEENAVRSLKNMVLQSSTAGKQFPIHTAAQFYQRIQMYGDLGVESVTQRSAVFTLLEHIFDLIEDPDSNVDEAYAYKILSRLLCEQPTPAGDLTAILVRARFVVAAMTVNREMSLDTFADEMFGDFPDPKKDNGSTASEQIEKSRQRNYGNSEKVELAASALSRDRDIEILEEYLYLSARDVPEQYRHGGDNPWRGELQLALRQWDCILNTFSETYSSERRSRSRSYRHIVQGELSSGGRWRSQRDDGSLPDTILRLNASVTPSLSGGFPAVRDSGKHPMTTNDPTDLEPIKPERAQELYLDHKASECREVTVQTQRYRTNHFVRWCEENGIDNLNEVSGRDLHEFRLWREEDGDLNKVSLQTQMCTLRVFLKYCGSIEAVTPNLYDKLFIPQLCREEEQRDTLLEAERAEEILSHLSRYHYASKEHVLFALLWETGMRIGAARSLDVRDVDTEDECLDLVHRPETETNLKNGQGGERLVAVSRELLELLENYIEDTRIEITDGYDRSPLLSTNRGRISRPSIRRIVYTLTAPCYLDNACPDCNDGSTKKCPEAVNPHAIRRGSITHFLTRDVPVEIVGDRMDVSRKVIDKHYDRRSEEVKVEQRRRYLDNI